jgi:hypothetical protein
MLIGIFAGFFAMIAANHFSQTQSISGVIGILVGLVVIAIQRNK